MGGSRLKTRFKGERTMKKKKDKFDICLLLYLIIFGGGQLFCFVMAIITGQLLLP